MTLYLALLGIALGALSGLCWWMEGSLIINHLRETRANPSLGALCCFPFILVWKALPLATDLAATWFLCTVLFGMGMSTLGLIIGLAISDVISVGLVFTTMREA